MTRKPVRKVIVLLVAFASCGCATMGDKTVADAKQQAPKDQEPHGFFRELIKSGYLEHTKDPDAALYP